ncbi:MAG: hypothetical protein LBJ01_04270 [Tannerella sp.]|jgi:hypothetical protein|nr:hypothetical protein [Tannerella sp.]
MRLFKCSACSKIHLEAGNVLVHFPSLERLGKFLNYLESIDPFHYASINRKKGLAKDIFLPVGDLAVNMAFTVAEFEELKRTVSEYLAAHKAEAHPPAGFGELMKIEWN